MMHSVRTLSVSDKDVFLFIKASCASKIITRYFVLDAFSVPGLWVELLPELLL